MTSKQSFSFTFRTPATKTTTSRFCGLILALSIVPVAMAQTKNCECEFDTKDYDAYGTNSACGIFMYNKAHTCEVSFSGTGANSVLIKKKLGIAAWNDQLRMSKEIFEKYQAFASSGNRQLFYDNSFVRNSLVVLVRGALFRRTTVDLPAVERIDVMFQDFSKEYTERVVATFSGRGQPFTVKWQEGGKWLEGVPWQEGNVFSIGKGYVELNFQNIASVRVVYFSDNTQ